MKAFVLKLTSISNYGYEYTDGLVILAPSEDRARELAREHTKGESFWRTATDEKYPYENRCDFWMDSDHSSCIEIPMEQSEGVILASYIHA